jgi:SnoaL-like protein
MGRGSHKTPKRTSNGYRSTSASGAEEIPMIYVAVLPTLQPELDHHRATIERFFAAIHAGDYPVLQEVLTPDAITRWPQSAERITGAMSCVQVYQNYPGGPPSHRVERISGDGDVWVAELVADYGDERWHLVSVIEFEGERIARMTDYFGPSFPAPEWRQGLVEREEATA